MIDNYPYDGIIAYQKEQQALADARAIRQVAAMLVAVAIVCLVVLV